ncbi:MAG: DUF1934 family protein [Ruminococcaceae bacterium]|nr:DUF1934 family protein [Oscillospiraceae bacterium]
MKVFIRLKSTVSSPEAENDTITHQGTGMLTHSGALLRVSFPLSGIMQTLVYDPKEPHRLELWRGGDRLYFDTAVSFAEGRYCIEGITLFPKIQTHSLEGSLTEKGGKVLIDYTLTLETEIQHFHMEIEVNAIS